MVVRDIVTLSLGLAVLTGLAIAQTRTGISIVEAPDGQQITQSPYSDAEIRLDREYRITVIAEDGKGHRTLVEVKGWPVGDDEWEDIQERIWADIVRYVNGLQDVLRDP